MADVIYTIGHSTHSIERFIELLRKHAITALCDVRSYPSSRMNPQFNRRPLEQALAKVGIKYVFLGKELGARTEDRSCFCDGKVQYDLLAKTELYRKGIGRIEKGKDDFRVALMCAEKEPLDCHRTILVSRTLDEEGLAICHILADGSLETHEHALRRLVRSLRLAPPDMFRSDEAVLSEAYAKQGQLIAYEERPAQPPETAAEPFDPVEVIE
jgi:uncharacterized protein (DUF488 family)